jgi:hypothetical protein
MIKFIAYIGLLFIISAVNQSMAACSVSGVTYTIPNGVTLRNILSGNTVCKSNGADWEWQEEHVSGGVLNDWKKGVGNLNEPKEQVGTWSTANSGGNPTVTYAYLGGSTYTYNVWQNGANAATATYDFCVGTTPVVTGTTIKSTTNGC